MVFQTHSFQIGRFSSNILVLNLCSCCAWCRWENHIYVRSYNFGSFSPKLISVMKDLCFSQSYNRKFESNSTWSGTGPELSEVYVMNSIWLNRTVLHFIVSCVLWRSMIILQVFRYLFHMNSKQTQPIRHAIRSCSYFLKRLQFYNKIVIYIYLPSLEQ